MSGLRVARAAVLVLGSLVSGLAFTPVTADAAGLRAFHALAAPGSLDVGESSFTVPQPPAFVPRSARTPDPVDTEVVTQEGTVSEVDGLPVSVEVVDAPAEPAHDPTITTSTTVAPTSTTVAPTTTAGPTTSTSTPSSTAPTSTSPVQRRLRTSSGDRARPSSASNCQRVRPPGTISVQCSGARSWMVPRRIFLGSERPKRFLNKRGLGDGR